MKKLRAIRIKRTDVQNIINKIPFTAFFGCKFVKANGELRKMNCNRSISTGLKNPRKPTLVTTTSINVYDVNVEGTNKFRRVNLDTIIEIRANGKKYIVV
jgi:hypothetical protein